VAQEHPAVGEWGCRTEERKMPGLVQLEQPGKEQAAEQRTEQPDWQQEGGARRYPARPIECDSAARHDHVYVRVVRHRRAPGMKHGGDADPGAEVLRVGRDGQHGLRCCPEQQSIDHRLVLPSDVGDLGGQREHDMEVTDRQQIGLARRQPVTRRRALALGTVPVTARVVGHPPVPAVFAGLDMTAHGSGAAVLDRRHHLELDEVQVPGMGDPIAGSGSTEDVGDLERGAHRLSRGASLANRGASPTGRAG